MVEKARVGVTVQFLDDVPVAGAVDVGAPGEVIVFDVGGVDDELPALVFDDADIVLHAAAGNDGGDPAVVDDIVGPPVVVVDVQAEAPLPQPHVDTGIEDVGLLPAESRVGGGGQRRRHVRSVRPAQGIGSIGR